MLSIPTVEATRSRSLIASWCGRSHADPQIWYVQAFCGQTCANSCSLALGFHIRSRLQTLAHKFFFIQCISHVDVAAKRRTGGTFTRATILLSWNEASQLPASGPPDFGHCLQDKDNWLLSPNVRDRSAGTTIQKEPVSVLNAVVRVVSFVVLLSVYFPGPRDAHHLWPFVRLSVQRGPTTFENDGGISRLSS